MKFSAYFIVTALALIQTAKAQDCSILEPWLTQGHLVLPPTSTYAQRNAQSQLEYALRVQTAAQLNAIYESGTLSQGQLDTCLATLDDRQNFLETFYYTMFSTSVQKLNQSKSPAVQALMAIFHAKFGQGIPVFRVTGSFGEQSPTPLPAGVQRATGSMYMNFAQIDPNDWMIIFTHETLHAVDDQIMLGVEGYANTSLVQRFVQLSQQTPSCDQLSQADHDSLNQWLMFGLDRGLLAEYRAWSATFLIYQQGLKEGLWNDRPWLDQIIVNLKPSEDLAYFTYQYLDPRSVDPTDGIFSNSLISSGLTELRQQLRSSISPPPLDDLAPVLAGAP